MEKIGIASDHAGFELKENLKSYLTLKGYEVCDFGTHSSESMDYPDSAHPLAKAIEKGECAWGVAMCGSGEGMAMTLNKHQGIRAGLVWSTDIAKLIKQHNNANIIVLPARFVSEQEAKELLNAFISTDFEGGRHQKRVDKIPCMD